MTTTTDIKCPGCGGAVGKERVCHTCRCTVDVPGEPGRGHRPVGAPKKKREKKADS